jgi:predicted DNA binding CopG/RHH family protein
MDPKYIDNEEKELMEAFENANNPESFKPSEEDQKKFKTAAKEFITSEKKMNIRIDPYELEKIKERAARELRVRLTVSNIRKKCITQIHYRAAG